MRLNSWHEVNFFLNYTTAKSILSNVKGGTLYFNKVSEIDHMGYSLINESESCEMQMIQDYIPRAIFFASLVVK